MCKKDVSPLDGHLTHHDSRLHNCTDGLIAPKSLPISSFAIPYNNANVATLKLKHKVKIM